VQSLAYFFDVELAAITSIERRIILPHMTDDMVTTTARAKHHIGRMTLDVTEYEARTLAQLLRHALEI
jgi:hypothetical protein